MGIEGIDPVHFRQAQHRNWDSAAVGWKEWSAFNGRADRHISERLVELAGVRPGSRVLDVAAGYGEPALTAARKAGPGGRVVATDISADMLAFGRERAAAAGLGNVEFVEATPPASTFREGASTPPSRAGGSSSSPTRRPPRRASAGSSSRGRGWRSPRGVSLIGSHSSRYR
ncbi:MAG TPA: class I SAM-dependent methyltransferase [Solirubrobacterales bacterium]|nr:class I SAM-dependent methyltransferase [Solirubrobacterales bacterium]